MVRRLFAAPRVNLIVNKMYVNLLLLAHGLTLFKQLHMLLGYLKDFFMALQSRLFAGDVKLEAAAVSDSAHILQGDRGEHVKKIQTALNIVDNANITVDGAFGPSTSAAVLSYKKTRNIINTTYQSQPDPIVGKMTMSSLDNDLFSLIAASLDIDTDFCRFERSRHHPKLLINRSNRHLIK